MKTKYRRREGTLQVVDANGAVELLAAEADYSAVVERQRSLLR